jgi:hypothetical protein
VKVKPEELDRRTKPFMVEGAVMVVEGGLFEFSSDDALLDEQLRAYVVKIWSSHGWANTYDSGGVGDHDLDATMLAMLGIELKYGVFYRRSQRPNTAGSMSMMSGFGQTSVQMPIFDRGAAAEGRAAEKAAVGVPSRQTSGLQKIAASAGRIAAMQRGGTFIVPGTPSLGRSMGGNATPSRTAAFSGRGAGYGRGGDGRNFRRFPL